MTVVIKKVMRKTAASLSKRSVSSLRGIIMPTLKAHAREGYSESLDHGVREFGVRVVVIEAAATRTSFETSTVPSDTPLAAYDASRAKYLVACERAMVVADTAESVAETIVRAARDNTPRLRHPWGKAARQVAFARCFVPRALFDKILRSQFGLA